MNAFDHYIKEVLKVKFYLRYTDDFIVVHDDPVELISLLPPMRLFLQEWLALDLHPRKIERERLSYEHLQSFLELFSPCEGY